MLPPVFTVRGEGGGPRIDHLFCVGHIRCISQVSVAFHVSTAKPGAQVLPCSKDMPRDISLLISSNGKRRKLSSVPTVPSPDYSNVHFFFKEANTTHPQILQTVLETNLVPCDCLQMDNFPELGHLASLLKYGIRSGSWQGSLAGPIILRYRSMKRRTPLPG